MFLGACYHMAVADLGKVRNRLWDLSMNIFINVNCYGIYPRFISYLEVNLHNLCRNRFKSLAPGNNVSEFSHNPAI